MQLCVWTRICVQTNGYASAGGYTEKREPINGVKWTSRYDSSARLSLPSRLSLSSLPSTLPLCFLSSSLFSLFLFALSLLSSSPLSLFHLFLSALSVSLSSLPFRPIASFHDRGQSKCTRTSSASPYIKCPNSCAHTDGLPGGHTMPAGPPNPPVRVP